MEILGFIFFLVAFAAIGLVSVRKSTDGGEDYLLAGRTLLSDMVAYQEVKPA